MDAPRTIHEMLCHICQRPAAATDEAHTPYCGRHALWFVRSVRLATAEPLSPETVIADVSAAASG